MSTTLRVRVIPNARQNAVVGWHGDALKIKIQAPALDGKANDALCHFLAEALRLKPRDIVLLKGKTSRDKLLVIAPLSEDELRQRIVEVTA